MKRILDDHGMKYLELEFLMDWFLDEGNEGRKASDAQRERLLEACAALDAHHLKIGNIPGTPAPIPEIIERYAELCAEAAGAANGGLAIDTWHMSKLGIAPDDLRRVPLEYLTWVELSDGQKKDMGDPVIETTQHRRLPGEGEFDIRGYVAVCQDMGYQGPWGVEVLSKALDELPMEEIFKRSYETTISQFQPVAA
jgi:sugar phosphate isomerase/epimerase